jgi:hypothetical protein
MTFRVSSGYFITRESVIRCPEPKLTCRPPRYYSIYDAPTEDWAAILGLAHHWKFSEVKALAIREMEKQTIPALTKITIYHRYEVNRDLLFQSYMDLCLREEPLTIAEAQDLGLETWLTISTAREAIRRGDGSASPTANRSSKEVERVIGQVFRLANLA